MNMTREQRKKLLLAEGALHRFECMQARRAISDELSHIAGSGPAGLVRAVSGRTLLSLAATILPAVLGASRVARLLKRGMLVAGGVAAAWSAIKRWRDDAPPNHAHDAGQQDNRQPGEQSSRQSVHDQAPPA